ncbi:MAG: chromosome segregation SMC family protein [Gaiella sp.]
MRGRTGYSVRAWHGAPSVSLAILARPVHLRSIKVRGFKSFPDPVEVKLEPGVAVVVGPNGSGKSNVSDAIVWAAGSLVPSALRAERPDDVLFAGGGDRPPADHCEVELVFDNEDGAFGGELDYSEISITRRLVRGGEGQYLVNRAPVRRIDLVELLADVGLGGSMHSIVSQGKVDAVLASKPEDRRALIEEAAGLGKFKQRKHRAELKLARVATQVDRARDVEEEVRKRLRPLALQATAAERSEKLVVEIAGLRARVAQIDLDAVAERRDGAGERRQAAVLARRGTQERLTALLEAREQAEVELSDAAGRREAALASLYRLQGSGERLTVRHESATGVRDRLAEDLAEADRSLAARSDAAVQALEGLALQAAVEARDAAQASGQAAERARNAHLRLGALERHHARSADERLERLAHERKAAQSALADAASAQARANEQLRALGSHKERLAGRRENAAGLHVRLSEDLGLARAVRARGGQTPAELEHAANEASAAARLAATERDNLTERARAACERLAALEGSLAEREGIPPAARALAEQGERLALGALDVEPGRERAVAAALGHLASAVLADDPHAGLALLRRAQEAGLGSLIVLASRDPRAIVDSLPLVSLDALLDADRASVTAEGFGYDPRSGELWFVGETAEALLMEMDGRRRTLVAEVAELEERARAAGRAADETRAAADAAEAAFAEVAHLRERTLDLATVEALVETARGLETLLGRASACVARLEGPIAARLVASTELADRCGVDLQAISEREAMARQDAQAAVTAAQAAEMIVARLGGARVETGPGTPAEPAGDRAALAREAAALLQEFEEASRVAREAGDRQRHAEAAVAERVPRRIGADPDLLRRLVATLSDTIECLERGSRLAERLQTPVRARADAGSKRAGDLGAELRRLGAEEVEVRRAAEEAAERVTAVDIELARLDAESAEARRRLDEAGAVEPAAGDDRSELQVRVERLDRRREELGKVNPLAREEYEEEKIRLDELERQRRDLEESLVELAKLRDELAETVTRRFDETFEAVSRNFLEVAETLFPGGEGRLRLVELEDGEGEHGIGGPGVEVELRPAGKKITRLSLLSGGEKALGAISFLFALFLAHPCPFYLLDEVEAALDDANIGRFVELLRRYADRAQFVVITHQKRTMEAADVLYGVTMGGDGVSQIVSRRLPQHDRVPAGAAASAG